VRGLMDRYVSETLNILGYFRGLKNTTANTFQLQCQLLDIPKWPRPVMHRNEATLHTFSSLRKGTLLQNFFKSKAKNQQLIDQS